MIHTFKAAVETLFWVDAHTEIKLMSILYYKQTVQIKLIEKSYQVL